MLPKKRLIISEMPTGGRPFGQPERLWSCGWCGWTRIMPVNNPKVFL